MAFRVFMIIGLAVIADLVFTNIYIVERLLLRSLFAHFSN